jgi:hypothetical protein
VPVSLRLEVKATVSRSSRLTFGKGPGDFSIGATGPRVHDK